MNTHRNRPGAQSPEANTPQVHHLPGAVTKAELDEVITYLRERHAGPGLSKFELSIATQLAHHKVLTRKQVDAILNKANLPGPEIIPAGNYAIRTDDGNDEMFFVKVWRGSRDASYVRVYVLEGIDEQGTELPTRQMLARIIATGPAKAARDYGRLTTRCSSCARKLTNALSRKLNIGPVCGGRFYDHENWEMIKLEATTWLIAHGIDPKADLPLHIDLTAMEEQA